MKETSMTYAELYREVEKLNPKGTYSIRVETWRHIDERGQKTDATAWHITTFDGDLLTHSLSEVSPEGVLALLRVRLERPEAKSVEDLVIDPPVAVVAPPPRAMTDAEFAAHVEGF